MAQEKSGVNHVKSSVLFPKLCLQGIRYATNWIFFFFSLLSGYLRETRRLSLWGGYRKQYFYFFIFLMRGKARSAGIVYWLLCLW